VNKCNILNLKREREREIARNCVIWFNKRIKFILLCFYLLLINWSWVVVLFDYLNKRIFLKDFLWNLIWMLTQILSLIWQNFNKKQEKKLYFYLYCLIESIKFLKIQFSKEKKRNKRKKSHSFLVRFAFLKSRFFFNEKNIGFFFFIAINEYKYYNLISFLANLVWLSWVT